MAYTPARRRGWDAAVVGVVGCCVAVIPRNRLGPTSAQPIRSSGSTASKAALPNWPLTIGSAMFGASVARLAKIRRRRTGRICSLLA